jgi:hypothetical protein
MIPREPAQRENAVCNDFLMSWFGSELGNLIDNSADNAPE